MFETDPGISGYWRLTKQQEWVKQTAGMP